MCGLKNSHLMKCNTQYLAKKKAFVDLTRTNNNLISNCLLAEGWSWTKTACHIRCGQMDNRLIWQLSIFKSNSRFTSDLMKVQFFQANWTYLRNQAIILCHTNNGDSWNAILLWSVAIKLQRVRFGCYIWLIFRVKTISVEMVKNYPAEDEKDGKNAEFKRLRREKHKI